MSKAQDYVDNMLILFSNRRIHEAPKIIRGGLRDILKKDSLINSFGLDAYHDTTKPYGNAQATFADGSYITIASDDTFIHVY